LEVGAALIVEGDYLAVDHRLGGAERLAEAKLGVLRGDLAPGAADEGRVAGVAVGDRAHAVPLDLVPPALVVAGKLSEHRLHRLDALRHRLPARVRGRVHAVDHPVPAAGPKERVAATDALAGEGEDHFVVAELLGLVGPVVPDRHRPGAVLTRRDRALELEVLQRVVLGVDREPVLVWVLRHALRQRPGDGDPLVFEPQVPVQVRRVVLLDDEAPGAGVRRARRLVPARLRGSPRRALRAVLVEGPARHRLKAR
jgi:hypothetical protein